MRRKLILLVDVSPRWVAFFALDNTNNGLLISLSTLLPQAIAQAAPPPQRH